MGGRAIGGMRSSLANLAAAAAAAVTVVVGVLTGGWPGFLIGSVLALSLWMMLLFGSYATNGQLARTVPPAAYAGAAVTGVLLGYLCFRLGDDNGAWWAVGFIVAGAATPWGRRAVGESTDERG